MVATSDYSLWFNPLDDYHLALHLQPPQGFRLWRD
jgi:hypothetical protein